MPAGDHVDELLVLIRRVGDRNLLGARAGQHQAVSGEIGADAHHQRHRHGDRDARPAITGGVADDSPEHAENHDHGTDQQPAVSPVAVDLVEERRGRDRFGHRSGALHGHRPGAAEMLRS